VLDPPVFKGDRPLVIGPESSEKVSVSELGESRQLEIWRMMLSVKALRGTRNVETPVALYAPG